MVSKSLIEDIIDEIAVDLRGFGRLTAQQGAYLKGYRARLEGEPRHSMPYQDHRSGEHGNIVTFSRTFIRNWFKGWDDANQELYSNNMFGSDSCTFLHEGLCIIDLEYPDFTCPLMNKDRTCSAKEEDLIEAPEICWLCDGPIEGETCYIVEETDFCLYEHMKKKVLEETI